MNSVKNPDFTCGTQDESADAFRKAMGTAHDKPSVMKRRKRERVMVELERDAPRLLELLSASERQTLATIRDVAFIQNRPLTEPAIDIADELMGAARKRERSVFA